MTRASLYSAILNLESACRDLERVGGLESEIKAIDDVVVKLKKTDKLETAKTIKVKSWLEMIRSDL